jgi:hypothetical protein
MGITGSRKINSDSFFLAVERDDQANFFFTLLIIGFCDTAFAAPLSTCKAYRDGGVILNRNYAKAFLGKNPGWGLVSLKRVDYNNFFGLMEINFAYQRTLRCIYCNLGGIQPDRLWSLRK